LQLRTTSRLALEMSLPNHAPEVTVAGAMRSPEWLYVDARAAVEFLYYIRCDQNRFANVSCFDVEGVCIDPIVQATGLLADAPGKRLGRKKTDAPASAKQQTSRIYMITMYMVALI